MLNVYPSGIDTYPAIGTVINGQDIDASHVAKLYDIASGIEETLGLNPHHGLITNFASVDARLTGLEEVVPIGGTANGIALLSGNTLLKDSFWKIDGSTLTTLSDGSENSYIQSDGDGNGPVGNTSTLIVRASAENGWASTGGAVELHASKNPTIAGGGGELSVNGFTALSWGGGGNIWLTSVSQDDTVDKILVWDSGQAGYVQWRDAATLGGGGVVNSGDFVLRNETATQFITGTLSPAISGELNLGSPSSPWSGVHTATVNTFPVTVSIFNEVPVGVVNGSNDTFTLTQAPYGISQQVFNEGVFMIPSGLGIDPFDFYMSGTSMIFSTAPTSGNRIVVANYTYLG